MELIEREAALEICEKEYQERLRMLDYCGDTVAWSIGGAIKALPTIDAVPVVHGRLIHAPSSNDRFEDCYKCSVCGAEYGADYFGPDVNYCTCCGARMDGGDGHEAD